MTLRAYARRVDDVLFPAGQLDVCLLYGLMAAANSAYLGDRELASKVHLPDGPTLIKRGSDLPPLTAAELRSAVDETFIDRRRGHDSLDDARDALTDQQAKVWRYFLPRKYCELHYATNYEGEGRPIDRIFFDIDRGPETTAEEALAVTRRFVEFLDSDADAQGVTDAMVISFTGNSFHVDLLLDGSYPPEFYAETVFTSETADLDTITDRAVGAVRDAVDVPVVGGHARQAGTVNIDPSQTPSGKLNRVPLGSLHLADADTVDGISVPVTRGELFEPDVISTVTAYTPRAVLDELDELAAKLP